MEKSIEQILSEIENQVVYKGYTQKELKTIFDAISDPQDWKAPITCLVNGEAVMPVVASIQFFTATEPKISLNVEHMKYIVTSEGYRNGPAGDH